MLQQVDVYLRIGADVHATLTGLSEEQISRRPDVPSANSGYVIATHVMGNARAWVLGIVCEQPLRRDRPGEFRSSGTYMSAVGMSSLAGNCWPMPPRAFRQEGLRR